jgi:Na+-translocating ferredoxin:NAD+ oxidoreductase RnfE subunit
MAVADINFTIPKDLAAHQPLWKRNPSVLVFIGLLSLFTIVITVMSEGLGLGLISTRA